MNTIFSKNLLAVVISSLLVGLTTSHDAFAQSSDVTDSVTNVSKQEEKERLRSGLRAQQLRPRLRKQIDRVGFGNGPHLHGHQHSVR